MRPRIPQSGFLTRQALVDARQTSHRQGAVRQGARARKAACLARFVFAGTLVLQRLVKGTTLCRRLFRFPFAKRAAATGLPSGPDECPKESRSNLQSQRPINCRRAKTPEL